MTEPQVSLVFKVNTIDGKVAEHRTFLPREREEALILIGEILTTMLGSLERPNGVVAMLNPVAFYRAAGVVRISLDTQGADEELSTRLKNPMGFLRTKA